MRCECCTEYVVTVRGRLMQGTPYLARLCDACAKAQHGRDRCQLCGAYVWHCGRVQHVAEQHPLVMEKLVNDPMTEDTPKSPPQRIIGQVKFR